jgi:hypothetical protein
MSSIDMHIRFERKGTQKSLSMTYLKSRKHNMGASSAQMFFYYSRISQGPSMFHRMSSAAVQILTLGCLNPEMRATQLTLMMMVKK